MSSSSRAVPAVGGPPTLAAREHSVRMRSAAALACRLRSTRACTAARAPRDEMRRGLEWRASEREGVRERRCAACQPAACCLGAAGRHARARVRPARAAPRARAYCTVTLRAALAGLAATAGAAAAGACCWPRLGRRSSSTPLAMLAAPMAPASTSRGTRSVRKPLPLVRSVTCHVTPPRVASSSRAAHAHAATRSVPAASSSVMVMSPLSTPGTSTCGCGCVEGAGGGVGGEGCLRLV